jgi:DNA replication protein DnaC
MELSQHKADGIYSKALKQLAKYDILILVDWRLETLKAAPRNVLMEIMDDKHQLTSTIMVSLLPTEE